MQRFVHFSLSHTLSDEEGEWVRYTDAKAEIDRLNQMIDAMLECANSDCTCRKGSGVCNQCREMVMKHRGEL
jgi:hypothetical protein